MDYRQTLDYLYSMLPMFQRVGPAAYKKDLTNTLALCEALHNPQEAFTSIHIAGTNGKGSVSHCMASILQSAGYKTGLYTSPHLVDFRERIRINGEPIPENAIIDFVAHSQPLIEEIQPSFFELTVAMAFDYFARQKVDFAVIETGLGGRLDSTNVVKPVLSIITNISYDHQNMLGNTLPEIAFEKAGIIKGHTPVVIGKYQEETAPVFEEVAGKRHAPLSYAPEHFQLLSKKLEKGLLEVDYLDTLANKNIHLSSPLGGDYQLENLATVLESVRQLRQCGIAIPEQAVLEGIRRVTKQTGLRGRWEVLNERPFTVVDVAHNEAGLRYVFNQVNSIPHKKLRLVYGMVKDKDVSLALDRLPKDAEYYFCTPQIPRGLAVEELYPAAMDKGLHGKGYPSVQEAFRHAEAEAGPDDLVLVAGSIFVAAEVLEYADTAVRALK